MKYLLFLTFFFINISQLRANESINNSNIDITKIEKILASDDISALDGLITNNLDVNMRNGNGDTLLLYALGHNKDLAMAKQLIIAGADVNAPSSETGMTPLIWATSMADTLQEQSKEFYNAEQVLVTEQDLKNFMLTQMTKAYEMLQILIDAGADVNQETPFGTPLMNAAKNEWNEPIIKKLLDSPIKVNLQDRLGRTALFYAAAFNCDKNISLLLAAGADVSIKDIDGRTYMEAKPNEFLEK